MCVCHKPAPGVAPGVAGSGSSAGAEAGWPWVCGLGQSAGAEAPARRGAGGRVRDVRAVAGSHVSPSLRTGHRLRRAGQEPRDVPGPPNTRDHVQVRGREGGMLSLFRGCGAALAGRAVPASFCL